MSKRAASPVDPLFSSGSQESTTKRMRTTSTPISTPSTRLLSSPSSAGPSNVFMTPTIVVDAAAAPSLLAQFGYTLPRGAALPQSVIFAFAETKPDPDSPPPPQFLRFDAAPDSNTLYLPVSRTSIAPAASSQPAPAHPRSTAPAASSQSASAHPRSTAPAASSQSANATDGDVFLGGNEDPGYGGIGDAYNAFLHVKISTTNDAFQNRRTSLGETMYKVFDLFNDSDPKNPCCIICRASGHLPDDHYFDHCHDTYAHTTRDEAFQALGAPALELPGEFKSCWFCYVLTGKMRGWHRGPFGKQCPNAFILKKWFYTVLSRPGNLPHILTSGLIPHEIEHSRTENMAAFRTWAVQELQEQPGTLKLHVLVLWWMDRNNIIELPACLRPLVVALQARTAGDNAAYANGQRLYHD